MKISAILAALLYAGAVGAQGSDAMRDAMRTYFEKEKTAALIGIGGAIAAGGTGGYLATQGDLAKGIGYSLIGIGVIGLVVGGSVYLRTDNQLAKLEKQLETTPREYKTFEGARMEQVIQRELAALDPEHRLLIVLRDIQGLSYQDIIRITGLQEGTLKSRLHRARLALKERLQPYMR